MLNSIIKLILDITRQLFLDYRRFRLSTKGQPLIFVDNQELISGWSEIAPLKLWIRFVKKSGEAVET